MDVNRIFDTCSIRRPVPVLGKASPTHHYFVVFDGDDARKGARPITQPISLFLERLGYQIEGRNS
jgi:hypothetical protein